MRILKAEEAIAEAGHRSYGELYALGYVLASVHEGSPIDTVLRVADDLMLALVRGDDAEPVLERYRQMIRGLPDEIVRAPERLERIQPPLGLAR